MNLDEWKEKDVENERCMNRQITKQIQDRTGGKKHKHHQGGQREFGRKLMV